MYRCTIGTRVADFMNLSRVGYVSARHRYVVSHVLRKKLRLVNAEKHKRNFHTDQGTHSLAPGGQCFLTDILGSVSWAKINQNAFSVAPSRFVTMPLHV